MMACKQWKDEWVAYLYDEIEPQETAVLEQHLNSCGDCQETLDALSATRGILKQSTPPVPLAPRVLMLQPRPRLRPAWAFAAGLAAAAAVFAIGMMAGQFGMDPAEKTTPIAQSSQEFSLADFDGMVPREEFDHAMQQTRSDFNQRIDQLAQPAAQPKLQYADNLVTREVYDNGILTLEKQMNDGLERDYVLILQQMVAAEVRTQNRINSNRRVLQAVTYASNPAIVEH
jgi:hypothetical protein